MMDDSSAPTLDDWLSLLQRDFEATPAGSVGFQLIRFDPANPQEYRHIIPDIESWAIPGSPTERRFLLRVARNVTSIDDADQDPAKAAVDIASYLQDFVMDELNRPWPSIRVNNDVDVVLEPRLDDSGAPSWAGKGMACHFGELDRYLTT